MTNYTNIFRPIVTEITDMFDIEYPVFMEGASVSNVGGIAVIDGSNCTPEILRKKIKAFKKELISTELPFGVKILVPKVNNSLIPKAVESLIPTAVDIFIPKPVEILFPKVVDILKE